MIDLNELFKMLPELRNNLAMLLEEAEENKDRVEQAVDMLKELLQDIRDEGDTHLTAAMISREMLATLILLASLGYVKLVLDKVERKIDEMQKE